LLFIFDLEVASQRAWSILIAAFIGALYFFQSDPTRLSHFTFTDEKKTTNYEIVGPFGMVLVACWLAVIDFKTPDVISKYTGIIIFVTIVNATAVHSELNERAEKRFVPDGIVRTHKIILWLFFAVLYLVATRYFLANGSWEWGLPNIEELFRQAFGEF
jgi:hypothetical protein